MRMLARVAAVAVLALSASVMSQIPASAVILQGNVIDHNAPSQTENDFTIRPLADIFMSKNGYVVVVLRNQGSPVGYEVLLNRHVQFTPYLERGATKTIIMDDVPLGGTVIVTAADGFELARLTVPDENS